MSTTNSALQYRNFERILLIKPSSLGDIVHALPVLHGLRQRYPAARIDWLVADGFAPLIDGHPELTGIVRFDRRTYGRMWRSPKVATSFASFVRNLRQRRYDLVVDLQGLFRSGFLALASGAPVRIGFSEARELAWTFYSHRIQPSPPDTHAVDRNYRVADLLGFADVPVSLDLAVTDAERERSANILQMAGVNPDRRFAAVLPGARWETKRWPPDRFAKVITTLQADYDLDVVLLAGADEAATCHQVKAASDPAPTNLAGQTSLRELVAILERAAVVICHDSAPMHLAAALGRPMVCILGPTNPARTGPYTKSAIVLQADWPCVPCYLRRMSRCRYDHRCMTALEPPRIVEAVAEALRSPTT